MEIMERAKSLLLLALVSSYTTANGLSELSPRPTKCEYGKVVEMYGASCAGLGLTKIPNLKSGIEILDFTDNKLRELTSETFSGCTGVKLLYLADNKIYSIDDDTFSSLTYLQILDLSGNVITNLPNSAFRLPSLMKLNLRANPLSHLGSELAITKPIKAPLEHLDLSDCVMKKLPDFGVLPQLKFYNISHNPLESLEPKHFAAMCNLKEVALTKSIEIIKICDLKRTIELFQMQQIRSQELDSFRLNSKEFEECPPDNMELSLNVTYHRCKKEYIQVQKIRTSRRTWLKIGGGLAGFLVCFILLLYIMHRYNVAQTKKVKKPPPEGDKNATAILLNNASYPNT